MNRGSTTLDGATVSVVRPKPDVYYDFSAVSGENKDEAKDGDKYQLMANMGKTVTDIANDAVQQGLLFNKITVFGFLIDYREVLAKKVYKMECDFATAELNFTRCEQPKLPIEEAFQTVTAILNNS